MKEYKKFLIHVSTNWYGEDNSYAAIAEDEEDLLDLLNELAYDNFADFGGFEKVLEELFEEQLKDDEDYSDEMNEIAAEEEVNYYTGHIEKWDETRSEEEWDLYELIYDASLEKSIS